MADIAALLARGSQANPVGSAVQGMGARQQLQMGQQQLEANQQLNPLRLRQARQNLEIGQMKIDAAEQAQINQLKEQERAQLAQKMDEIATVATQAQNKEQLVNILQGMGAQPDALITDPNVPFEVAQQSVLAKSKAYREAALKNLGKPEATGPAAVQEFQFYKKLPKEDKKTFMSIKRADPRVKFQDVGDRVLLYRDGMKIGEIEKTLPPEKKPGAISEQEVAKAEGKREGELKTTRTKMETTLSAKDSQLELMNELIDEAKGQAGAWTTGFLGGTTQFIPGTPAHNLNNTLNTIRANVGFDKLQEMRDSSPTGGALGQVSEQENKLLQSVFGALEQSQTKDQFKKNLDRVKKQVRKSWDRVEKAYELDYGIPYQGDAIPTPETQEEFDALPSGSVYIDPDDGHRYRKP
jgi:hypothetical protein